MCDGGVGGEVRVGGDLRVFERGRRFYDAAKDGVGGDE